MVKSIIVGIDIGTTTGIAIYDLNRNLLYTGSKRYLSISSVIKQIIFFGKPLIIATDKEKTPSPISKIAASFNGKVFHPDHDLAVEEKDDIVKISIKDVHEKDALAAATFAYKNYAGQFNNIDMNLDSLGLRQYSDRVKEMIIKKEARNIAEAIEKIKPKKEEEKIEPKFVLREVNLDWKERVKEYEKRTITTGEDFSEWLQFVYLPNRIQEAESRHQIIEKIYIVPQAMKFFGSDIKKGKLLQLLIELDSLS